MRFGDGAWRMLPEVTPTYASRVDGFSVGQDELLLNVASRMEEARWATLEGDMFTVRITSVLENVVRIQVTHHKGRKRSKVAFEVLEEARPLPIEQSEQGFQVRAGALRVIVDKKPYGLTFIDDRTAETITTSPFKSLGMMDKMGSGRFLRDQLTLSVGEQIYGLGERFSALCRNGQTVDMFNSDCGTCSDKGYKDVPFFLSSKGYGVYVNSPGRVSFEVGTEQVTRTQFAIPGEDLDYYLILGPSPKEVLDRLGALTGRPPLPPAWSFGLWLTTSFTTDYDEKTVMEQIDGMAERTIPLHVFHFDCFWMKGHHWCNFRWDEDVFPDPPAMLKRLHERGLKICVWINPYIGERSHLFDEGLEHGYLLKKENGDVYQRPKWQAGMAYVDFSNPSAVAWYQGELRNLLKMGVDCFKTDFGEEIPLDVVYHDGSDPKEMHQYYTYLFNKAVFELLEEERGKDEALVFARSATATCQRFPVHWGGDCYGTFESMAESLRGGLSLTMCGFGYWSHDIGGFESKASAAVYKRWVAFGLMSSHSRLHGSTSYRVPWLYDEEAVDVVRHFTRLKCQLMPYLMRASLEAHEKNTPMMRAMVLEHPDDPTCRTLDRQYYLGDSLLVAPVFHERRSEYYLPHGNWTQLSSGEVRQGGRWFFEEQNFFEMPVWIKENSAIALGSQSERVDYALDASLRLLMGKLDGETPIHVTVNTAAGEALTSFVVSQASNQVTVENESGRKDYSIHLPWAVEVTNISGGEPVTPPKEGGFPTGGVMVTAKDARLSFTWR